MKQNLSPAQRWSRALVEAEKLGKESPWYSISLRNLSRSLLDNAQWKPAKRYVLLEVEALERFDEHYPLLADAFVKLANIENAEGNYEKALEYLRKAGDIAETSPISTTIKSDILALRTVSYYATGRDTEAEKCVDEIENYLSKAYSENEAAGKLFEAGRELYYTAEKLPGKERYWFYRAGRLIMNRALTPYVCRNRPSDFNSGSWYHYLADLRTVGEKQATEGLLKLFKISDQVYAKEPAARMEVYAKVGVSLVGYSQYASGAYCLERARALFASVPPDSALRFDVVYYRMACHLNSGEAVKARSLCAEAKKFTNLNAKQTYELYIEMTAVYNQCRDEVSAVESLDHLQTYLKNLPDSHPEKFQWLKKLVDTYTNSGFPNGEKLALELIPKLIASEGENSKKVAEMNLCLSKSLYAQSKYVSAMSAAKRTVAIATKCGAIEVLQEALEYQGRCATQEYDYARAQSYYLRLANLSRHSIDSQNILIGFKETGLNALRQRDYDLGEKYMRMAIKQSEQQINHSNYKTANLYLFTINMLISVNQRPRAIPWIDQVIKLTADAEDKEQKFQAVFMKAYNCVVLKDLKQAEELVPALRKVAYNKDREMMVPFIQCGIAHAKGDQPTTLKCLDQATAVGMEIQPEEVRLNAQILQVWRYYDYGFSKQGLQLTNQLIPLAVKLYGRSNKDLVTLYKLEALLKMREGNLAEAKAAIDKAYAVCVDKENRNQRHSYAEFYLTAHDLRLQCYPQAAEYACLKVLPLSKSRPSDLLRMQAEEITGDVFLLQNKLSQAQEHYLNAMDICSGKPDLDFNRYLLLEKTAIVATLNGDPKGKALADQVLNEPLKSQRAKDYRALWYAQYLFFAGQNDEALHLMPAAIEGIERQRDPKALMVRVGYANALFAAGRFDEARKVLKPVESGWKAARFDVLPLESAYLMMSTRLALQSGDRRKAHEFCQQAARAMNTSITSRSSMSPGLVFLQGEEARAAGDLKRARQLYERALSMYANLRTDALDFRIDCKKAYDALPK